jgi:AcrR family transcriptional regulator
MQEPSDINPDPHMTTDHRPRVAAERRERMRSRLLRSTLRLVAEKGPMATSIEDVISAAKVSRGTFYKYFPSSEVLIQELVVEIVNELIQVVDPAVRKHDDPAELVARGIRLVSRLAIHQPALAACLVRLGWREGQWIDILKFVKQDLEEGFRRGRFKRVPMALAVNILAGASLAATERMLESDFKEDYSMQAAALALRALGVDPAEADAISKQPLDSEDIRIVGWFAETLGSD